MHRVRDGPGAGHRRPDHATKYIGDWVAWGAGPRAGQSLILAAKAPAALVGRPSVSVEDIQSVAQPVLRHRIVINYNAQAAGETSDSIVKKLPQRRSGQERTCECRRRGNTPILMRSPRSLTWSCDLAAWSRVRSAGSIAARFTGSTSNSPNIASTPPATTSAGSTGGSSRSDRHYIKQYEEESNVRVTFVVDASASMNYRGTAPLSKFDYGSTMVVSLAMMLARQQDPVGLVLFDEAATTVLPPAATQTQVMVMAGFSKHASPAQDRAGRAAPRCCDRLRRRSLLVIVSDLFTDLDAVYDGLNRLRFHGHEVLMMQVLDRDELELPFDGPTIFHDIEGNEELFAEPWAFRLSYQQAMQEFLDGVRREFGNRGYDHVRFLTDEPLGRSLSCSCIPGRKPAGSPGRDLCKT